MQPAAETGSSLLELVVLTALVLLIVGMGFRWTFDLFDHAVTARTQVSATQDASDIEYVLHRDLSRIQSCLPTRIDPPIIVVAPSDVSFIADIDGDGDGDYVRYWRDATDGWLYRQVAYDGDVGNPCTFTNNLETPEPIAPIEAGTLFAVRTQDVDVEGTPVEISARVCRGLTEDFDQCDFTDLIVTINHTPQADGLPGGTVNQEYPLTSQWGNA